MHQLMRGNMRIKATLAEVDVAALRPGTGTERLTSVHALGITVKLHIGEIRAKTAAHLAHDLIRSRGSYTNGKAVGFFLCLRILHDTRHKTVGNGLPFPGCFLCPGLRIKFILILFLFIIGHIHDIAHSRQKGSSAEILRIFSYLYSASGSTDKSKNPEHRIFFLIFSGSLKPYKACFQSD